MARPQPHEANRRLLRHLGNERGALFSSPGTDGVDATNWRAEQAVRPAVVNRKLWGGNRTDPCARTEGRVMTFLRTAHQQGADANAMLVELAWARARGVVAGLTVRPPEPFAQHGSRPPVIQPNCSAAFRYPNTRQRRGLDPSPVGIELRRMARWYQRRANLPPSGRQAAAKGPVRRCERGSSQRRCNRRNPRRQSNSALSKSIAVLHDKAIPAFPRIGDICDVSCFRYVSAALSRCDGARSRRRRPPHRSFDGGCSAEDSRGHGYLHRDACDEPRVQLADRALHPWHVDRRIKGTFDFSATSVGAPNSRGVVLVSGNSVISTSTGALFTVDASVLNGSATSDGEFAALDEISDGTGTFGSTSGYVQLAGTFAGGLQSGRYTAKLVTP